MALTRKVNHGWCGPAICCRFCPNMHHNTSSVHRLLQKLASPKWWLRIAGLTSLCNIINNFERLTVQSCCSNIHHVQEDGLQPVLPTVPLLNWAKAVQLLCKNCERLYITSPGDSWKTIPLSQKCRTSISNNPLLFFLQNISSLSVLQKTATNTSNGARLSICIMEEVSLLTLDLIDLSVQFPNSHSPSPKIFIFAWTLLSALPPPPQVPTSLQRVHTTHFVQCHSVGPTTSPNQNLYACWKWS